MFVGRATVCHVPDPEPELRPTRSLAHRIGQMNDALELALLPAFPAALATDVRVVAQALLPARLHAIYSNARHNAPDQLLAPIGSFTVRVQGEHLTIPGRLYNPEPGDDVFGQLSAKQTKLLHCLYTRHHDGYVRQYHLNQIIDATDPWIVPFVVQLAGEYVLDIVITIQQQLIGLNHPGTPHHQAYGQFAATNPDFLHLTSQRVASYWNCYYRHRGAHHRYAHRDYPGRVLINSLQDAAATYRATSNFTVTIQPPDQPATPELTDQRRPNSLA